MSTSLESFAYREHEPAAEHAEPKPRPFPSHIAIIMDGNRRWAKRHMLPVFEGHNRGLKAVRRTLLACERLNVRVLSLFAFSSENWRRSKSEVKMLIKLFENFLSSQLDELCESGVRLRFIGGRDRFPDSLNRLMETAERQTSANGKQQLVIAADYGGRWDIVQAASALAKDVANGVLQPEDVDSRRFGGYLSLPGLPNPDMCIRTAGEQRLSNFMLWQFAYTEFFFTGCLWPDFDESVLEQAIHEYANRKRNFGE